MAGHVAQRTCSHDVAHCPRGPRAAGRFSDIAVSRNPPGGNPPYGGYDSGFEVTRNSQLHNSSTSKRTPNFQLPNSAPFFGPLGIETWNLGVRLGVGSCGVGSLVM
jgi:hypothetical protein